MLSFQLNAETAPVLLWLQGGPGGSSLFGLFNENGPLQVTSDLEVIKRNTSWSLTHHIIYIDNPVGTGFSFTKKCYASNQDQVGTDLYMAMLQFFVMFPALRSHDFYVTGESYAGKYVPALTHKIHISNPKTTQKINLKGMAILKIYIFHFLNK
jgi:vitellogenic carboxypeptidase-like protein